MSSQTHFLSTQRILISGAGISGLAFAISLHKLWPSISASPPPHLTLYERDPCAVPSGREGYSLSLRSDRPSAGIQTLQKMGMLDKLLAVCVGALGEENREGKTGEEGGFVVWDRDWKEVLKVRSKTPEGCPVAGMRITRANLRRTLVEAVEELPGVEIQWGTSITGISQTGEGATKVELSDGRTQECDILIAADGSNSKIRSILRPNDGLKFAGPVCIAGTSDLSTSPSNKDNEFGMVLSGTGSCLFLAPVDTKSLVWCLSWKVTAPQTSKKQPLTPEEHNKILDEARQKGIPAYGKRFADMIEKTDESTLMKFNAMDKQGFPHTGRYIQADGFQSANGKIVFLGDANHAVSPFAGNGANLALMDGWDFAESLCRSGSLEDAVKKYDRLAVGRAKKVVSISHFNILTAHSKGWALWCWMWVIRLMKLLFFK
ncbi:FAD/NAD(P)-binding domain-containing protein [Zopfia rhizophila CBS 207.26]|uniref:FAD/NAD(P)-binding domain-containing protein n=1 Tax=Zopfia rhizophila CBS 207.26 TaxID=1314779 RepID=A0A6A6E793_9PEZI|nr:FAD/NAD(P)-binding domain-containing protein [Zopfia rhizophila CBS 207.26]